MGLVSLKRTFSSGDMTEERLFECTVCGKRATINPVPAIQLDVAKISKELAALEQVAAAHSGEDERG